MADLNTLLQEEEEKKKSPARMMTRRYLESLFNHAVDNRELIVKEVRKAMLDKGVGIPHEKLTDDVILAGHMLAALEDAEHGIAALMFAFTAGGHSFERVHNLVKKGMAELDDGTEEVSI